MVFKPPSQNSLNSLFCPLYTYYKKENSHAEVKALLFVVALLVLSLACPLLGLSLACQAVYLTADNKGIEEDNDQGD